MFSGQMMLKFMLPDEPIIFEFWDEVLRRRQAKNEVFLSAKNQTKFYLVP
jgi:hypothetical protein